MRDAITMQSYQALAIPTIAGRHLSVKSNLPPSAARLGNRLRRPEAI